jgi:hypothetical protein
MGNHSNGCGNHFECFSSKCAGAALTKFWVVPVFSEKLPSSVTLNVGAPTFSDPFFNSLTPQPCFTGPPDDFILKL